MDAISSLKLPDLKRELKARGLSSTGQKQVLVDRLIAAMSAEKVVNDDSNLDDDLLDEDSMLGEEESDSGSDDNNAVADLIASPTSTIPPISLGSPTKNLDTLKRPVSQDQNGTSANGDGAPPSKKKIILNRQSVPEAAPPVLPQPTVATAESVSISKEIKSPGSDSGDKAVIKLSEVTTAPVTDKLKLRQQKFGADLPTTADAADKLKKRADRFGGATAAAEPSKAAASQPTPVDDEKLAKRRERFGIATSDKIDEMKEKRAARFGLGAKSADPAEVEEKKKLRAARFAS